MMQNRVTAEYVSIVRRSAACASPVKLSASSRIMSLKGATLSTRGGAGVGVGRIGRDGRLRTASTQAEWAEWRPRTAPRPAPTPDARRG